MFIICLTGQAEWWMQNHIINDDKYHELPFEQEGEVKGLLDKFKEKYVTDEWYELYTQQYEDRKQLVGETPTEYFEVKRYLFQRSGQDTQERSVKQQVRDITKGLLPEVTKFCDLKLKDPFDTRIKQTMESFDSVAKLLKWAENCLFDEKKALVSQHATITTSKEVVPVHNVTRRPNTNNNNNYRSNYSGHADNVLDKIENDIAVLKDRVDLLEKVRKGVSGSSTSNNPQQAWVEGSPRCYNCQNLGHFDRPTTTTRFSLGFCPTLGGAEPSQIKPRKEPPDKSTSRGINVIQFNAGDEQSYESNGEQHLVATNTTPANKTAEELRAVKLNNLEKAREAKSNYKKLDDEAKTRGEIPPSIARKVERNFPIMLDANKEVQSLDLKEQLWNTNISIALPQLLYYAPELWYQYLHLLGGQPIPGSKRKPVFVGWY
ncbi:hypothetical protein BD770DRAFT_449744 [Pilaira anomala]|nr:hypothetical protein BD770DRAFT_449744 [Pilaira anomala]